MAHTVRLPDTFQGPLDLLLFLVRRDEIDIYDIPIAHLTREYLKEIERLNEIHVDSASEFMAMAAMLLEIKSRTLLPPAAVAEEGEDEAMLDPRQGLVQALLEYKRFKEAAAELGTMAERHAQRFARIAPELFAPEGGQDDATMPTDPLELLAAFQGMLEKLVSREGQEIVNDEVPTEVRIEQIREAVRTAGRTRFSRLLSSRPTRGEMVGFFIALLELIRLREVRARQAAHFDDIHIEPRTAGDPPNSAGEEAPRAVPIARRRPMALFPSFRSPVAVEPIRPVRLFAQPPRLRSAARHTGPFPGAR